MRRERQITRSSSGLPGPLRDVVKTEVTQTGSCLWRETEITESQSFKAPTVSTHVNPSPQVRNHSSASDCTYIWSQARQVANYVRN